MDASSLSNLNDYQLLSALKEALASGDTERSRAIIERLLEPTPNINVALRATEALLSVLDRNIYPDHPVDAELVELLLGAGASVASPFDARPSALYLALFSGSPEVAAKIMDAGADIHFRPSQPRFSSGEFKSMLVYAIEAGQTEAALRMLAAGADSHGERAWPRPLQVAARFGDLKVAAELVKLGVDVNESHPNSVRGHVNNATYQPSDSALMEAAKIENNPVLELLLKEGADANIQNDEGWTALHYTSWMNQNGVTSASKNVEVLLKYGADPNARDNNGQTPITRTLQNFYSYLGEKDSASMHRIISSLLSHGADPNHATDYGTRPLHGAIANNDVKVAVLLLAAGAKVMDMATTLWLMAWEGEEVEHHALIQLLNEHRLELDFNKLPALLVKAIANGDLKRVQLLIQKGVDVSAMNGDTPLHDAAEFGFADIVEELLRAGADPNFQISGTNPTALMLALDQERNRVDRDGRGVQTIYSELIPLAIEQDLSIVRALLEAGTDLQIRNPAGYTALHLAALKSSPPVLQALIEAGADVHARTDLDRTPLVALTANTRRQKLLKKDPRHIDFSSEELSRATTWDQEAVRLLLAAGSDVKAKGKDGFDALALAALSSTPEVCRMLVGAGASVSSGVGGWPVPSLVLGTGRTISLLKQHGFDFESFRWLEEDLKACASGDVPVADVLKNAKPQLVCAFEEDIAVLKLFLND